MALRTIRANPLALWSPYDPELRPRHHPLNLRLARRPHTNPQRFALIRSPFAGDYRLGLTRPQASLNFNHFVESGRQEPEVYDHDDHYEVVARLPGLDPSSVTVTFDEDASQLRLSGSTEQAYGSAYTRYSFQRTLPIPDLYSIESEIASEYRNGVLRVFLRKADEAASEADEEESEEETEAESEAESEEDADSEEEYEDAPEQLELGTDERRGQQNLPAQPELEVFGELVPESKAVPQPYFDSDSGTEILTESESESDSELDEPELNSSPRRTFHVTLEDETDAESAGSSQSETEVPSLF